MIERFISSLARQLGVAETTVQVVSRPPIDFQSNRLYDVWVGEKDHLIAKEYLKPDEQEEAPAREFRALHKLVGLDIAPRPIFFDPALAPVVVYEFMPGNMWDRQRPTSRQLAELAWLFAQMHTLPTKGLWTSRAYEQTLAARGKAIEASFQAYASWAAAPHPYLQPIVEACLLLLAQYEAMAQELADYQPTLTFCRLDSRFANIIARPDGRLGLVDWEDSGLGDPALDLADLLTAANQEDLLDRAEWEAFLRPYLTQRSLQDPTLEKRIQLYEGILAIFWLGLLLQVGVGKARSGQLLDWHVNGMPANRRLCRYLARAQAWPEQDFTSRLGELRGVVFFPLT